MEKRKLKKMKVLEPSEEMVLAAESDIPAIGNMAYERMEYPIGLFIQAEMDENILKIGFFVTDILTAGEEDLYIPCSLIRKMIAS